MDAANNEVHCPPEVFAPAFRFLRNFKSQEFAKESMFLPPVSPRLSATYHVGEDFLDIASALRAIDETIEFLDYRRGDRLGHALGLGIAPEVHYAKKGSRIFMPKQQRLDDLVWLLYRGRELGTHIDPHMYGLLKKEAEILLLEIYGDVIRNNRWMITLTEYHCCMQLRGGTTPLCTGIPNFPVRDWDTGPMIGISLAGMNGTPTVRIRQWPACITTIIMVAR